MVLQHDTRKTKEKNGKHTLHIVTYYRYEDKEIHSMIYAFFPYRSSTHLDTFLPISSKHRHTCRGFLCRTAERGRGEGKKKSVH